MCPRRDDRETVITERGRGGRPVFKRNNSSQENTRANKEGAIRKVG